jgi:hypothetical protein
LTHQTGPGEYLPEFDASKIGPGEYLPEIVASLFMYIYSEGLYLIKSFPEVRHISQEYLREKTVKKNKTRQLLVTTLLLAR